MRGVVWWDCENCVGMHGELCRTVWPWKHSWLYSAVQCSTGWRCTAAHSSVRTHLPPLVPPPTSHPTFIKLLLPTARLTILTDWASAKISSQNTGLHCCSQELHSTEECVTFYHVVPHRTDTLVTLLITHSYWPGQPWQGCGCGGGGSSGSSIGTLCPVHANNTDR